MTVIAADPYAAAAPADVQLRLAAAERALVEHAYKKALDELDGLRISRADGTALALHAAALEGAALRELGRLDEAVETLEVAHTLADDEGAPALDGGDSMSPRSRGTGFSLSPFRAAVLYELGATRLAAGVVAEACSLLTLALDDCNRSADPSDRLRTQILERRARCHRHNRDWAAARADCERALELADSVGDERLIAQACFQSSIVAEREGQWILAKFLAERARELFVQLGDIVGVGKCLNNIGGLAFLLGKPDEARKLLRDSFRILLDAGRDADAAYAVSSLAQVQLRSGEFDDAERLARRALVFIGSRPDHRTELGNAQIVLGRALLELGRMNEAEAAFLDAEHTLERSAIGERAAVWLAQGEAATRRGDTQRAAALYRNAAEALQDFHF
jgi:tetratricopeptide (TPR) repeat protein